MRAILTLFVWMLTVPCLQASVVNDSLLTRMDKVLADRVKISSMKNVRIKALTDYVKKVKEPRNLLQIYESLKSTRVRLAYWKQREGQPLYGAESVIAEYRGILQ